MRLLLHKLFNSKRKDNSCKQGDLERHRSDGNHGISELQLELPRAPCVSSLIKVQRSDKSPIQDVESTFGDGPLCERPCDSPHPISSCGTQPPGRRNWPLDDYVHNPLDHSRKKFRLFRLQHVAPCQSGSGETVEIRGELATFDFDHASMPEYVALSYTWGSPSSNYHVRINDQPYMVRENLFKFLCAYRKDPRCDTHPFLWIDQICIDQKNTNERNHQVRLMKSVYSRAHLVVSWLDDSSYDAICTFHDGGTPGSLRSAVTDMLSNKYFTRLWVVQEFLLAKALVIFCRDVWINREAVTRILNRDIYRVDYTGGSKEALFRRSSYRPSGDIEMPFYTCVLHWVSMDCESIHDKVYGFLGLVSHEVTDIDYDKPVQEVYLDAVRYVLEDKNRSWDSAFATTGLIALSQLATQMHLFNIADGVFVRFLEEVRRVVSVQLQARYMRFLKMGFRRTPNEKPNQWWYTFDGKTYEYDW